MTVETNSFASSNLQSGSFNSDTGEMHIVFRGGRSYVWQDISPGQWIGLKSAFSPGNYLRENFPDGTRE